MFVCKKCHENDRIVTKCCEDYEAHLVTVYAMSFCSICGKPFIGLKWCPAYKHAENIRKDKEVMTE